MLSKILAKYLEGPSIRFYANNLLRVRLFEVANSCKDCRAVSTQLNSTITVQSRNFLVPPRTQNVDFNDRHFVRLCKILIKETVLSFSMLLNSTLLVYLTKFKILRPSLGSNSRQQKISFKSSFFVTFSLGRTL